MAKPTVFIDTGINLTSSYYLRNFYTQNRDARTASKRADFSNSELSQADATALRRAVKNLGSFEYNDSEMTNIRASVHAYINTYNNLVNSTNGSEDRSIGRNRNQLTTLTNEYSNELDKAGITVNSNGTLTARDMFSSSDNKTQLKKLFSEDSDFMQNASACAKRLETRSKAVIINEKNAESAKKSASNNNTVPNSNPIGTSSILAELVSGTLGSDTLLSPGVGTNINISL